MIRSIARARRVAACAWHRDMRALQRETGLVMSRQRVAGWIPCRRVVTALAPVIARRRGKLPFVHILMARGALRERHFVLRVFAFGHVALRARHLRMFLEQRIRRRRMILDGVTGRLPGFFVVARFAVASIFTMNKLPAVNVSVAIQAAIKRNGCFEILGLVTVLAGNRGVFAQQRVLRLAVIEAVAGIDLLPAACHMAQRAIAAKGLAMNVFVTRPAIGVLHKIPVRNSGGFLVDRNRLVAPVAGDVDMQARERVTALVMREPRWFFPRVLRVAIGARALQLAHVHVAMASRAGGFQSRKCLFELATFERRPVPRIDVFCGVALRALQLRVFPFELPTGLKVVELFLRHRPSHYLMVQPVVLGMAARAIVIAGRRFNLRGVIPALLRQAKSNFLVTVQTAQLWRSRAEHVAFSALQRPVEIVMCLAEWTRRHLGRQIHGAKYEDHSKDQAVLSAINEPQVTD